MVHQAPSPSAHLHSPAQLFRDRWCVSMAYVAETMRVCHQVKKTVFFCPTDPFYSRFSLITKTPFSHFSLSKLKLNVWTLIHAFCAESCPFHNGRLANCPMQSHKRQRSTSGNQTQLINNGRLCHWLAMSVQMPRLDYYESACYDYCDFRMHECMTQLRLWREDYVAFPKQSSLIHFSE